MAPNQDHGMTLTGLPHEIVLKVLHCLFEDEYAVIANGHPSDLGKWPVGILQTCHLLNLKGKKAIRARLAECGLLYDDDHPPAAECTPANGRCWQQLLFFSQYGDCIKKVTTYAVELWGKFSMHWFPNLEVYELQGSAYDLEVDEVDEVYVHGKLKKEGLLKLFREQYYETEDIYCPMSGDMRDLLQQTTRGLDRTYTMQTELELNIREVGSWVSAQTVPHETCS